MTFTTDAALSALDEAPSTPNASYVAELRRGWLLYRLGKNGESVAAYRKATALAPASIEARIGALAPLAVLRRWVDIESTARETLRKDPGNYQATLRLAFGLYSLAKFAEAASTYRALLSAYPSDVDAGGGLAPRSEALIASGRRAFSYARTSPLRSPRGRPRARRRSARRGRSRARESGRRSGPGS